ncbi:MAG: 2-oxoacid:acceptor oxidoreductase subunit alpha [Prevotellaceae bacterium]|jgi:2-oxoglutarate ferredoxin oxidoreductase subunit alpha|nr:2-oxoacid:acceptor oxidoreductase subunit alpha [Prevotellaceae bacterium]
MDNTHSTTLSDVVIRFAGDSGDGMQLTGTLLSNLSAALGNQIVTFPDYPAEIRAPQGTPAGVSGFQVHVGNDIHTPGDKADVLVVMNPAALRVNADALKRTGVLIFDADSFSEKDLNRAGFTTDNPFVELSFPETVQLLPVPFSELTLKSLEGFSPDNKTALRSKNMFALGLICWLFDRPLEQAIHFLDRKFGKKPDVVKANIKVMTDGYNYGHNLHLTISPFHIDRAVSLQAGRYTIISGNRATAFGLIAAAQKSGRSLFLGSYPITPATDILQELAMRKDLGVKSLQAEDEIAGICMAIGASFAGNLAATSTSGPGISLKSEAIGLAVMAELPLVIINVMRGGPSTGLPTKTEQTDLQQALYGRNGECPIVVMAPSAPDDCFHYAYMACKIALENMTPVILLSDAFVGNGSSLWKLPKLADLPDIHPHIATEAQRDGFNSVTRNQETKVRYWSFPGMDGFAHRDGGLEKDYLTAEISTDGKNHALMVATREAKIAQIAEHLPQLTVEGDVNAELLVVSWGSTCGHIKAAVNSLNSCQKPVAWVHFNYINPLPKDTETILRRYKKVVVCELNSGQLAAWLRAKIDGIQLSQYNKVEGQPFSVAELVDNISSYM